MGIRMIETGKILEKYWLILVQKLLRTWEKELYFSDN